MYRQDDDITLKAIRGNCDREAVNGGPEKDAWEDFMKEALRLVRQWESDVDEPKPDLAATKAAIHQALGIEEVLEDQGIDIIEGTENADDAVTVTLGRSQDKVQMRNPNLKDTHAPLLQEFMEKNQNLTKEETIKQFIEHCRKQNLVVPTYHQVGNWYSGR